MIHDLEMQEAITVPKSKKRSIDYTRKELPDCFAKKKVEPPLNLSSASSDTQIQISELECRDTTYETIWSLCRGKLNGKKTVPQWSGWISKLTVQAESAQSVIGYMEPILYPITDLATIQECLVTSQRASTLLGQSITLVTMDLGAARLAFDVQSNDSKRFSDVIINLGAFHTMCSYMGAVGKMMCGSGFEDILIESGVCASGSINQVISGKHYNRAMNCHQVMNDSPERMLLEQFFNTSTAFSNEQIELMLADFSELAQNPGA